MNRGGWTGCSLIPSLAVVLSCGPGYVAPEDTGGELLPETEAWEYFGTYPFSTSPDGRWLLFVQTEDSEPKSQAYDLEAEMLSYVSGYRLYDLSNLEATGVVLGADARDFFQGRGGVFLPTGGCWIPRGDGWWAAIDLRGRYLVADPGAVSPEWVVADTEPYAFPDECALEVPWEVPQVMGRFRIAEPRGQRITIVDAEDPETVLARHRAPRFPGMHIAMSRVRLAPDGTRLAYDTGSMFGSFAGRSMAFVLSYDAGTGPTALASGVYALRWGVDDTILYAAVAGEGARGIYRWRVDEVKSEMDSR